MDSFPEDKVPMLVEFLSNDHRSLCRLMSCSKDLKRSIVEYMTQQHMWTRMRYAVWSYGQLLKDEDSVDTYEHEVEFYRHRLALDGLGKTVVEKLTDLLESRIGDQPLPATVSDWREIQADFQNNDDWQTNWRILLSMRAMIHNQLHRIAQFCLVHHHSTRDRIMGFIAARSMIGTNLLECLHQWQRTFESDDDIEPNEKLEDYVFLAVQLQLNLNELLQESNVSTITLAKRKLDEIADECRDRVANCSSTLEQIRIVNQVLFDEMNFDGNVDDYYNYRNSLLHWVLEHRKGIPMTLAVLFIVFVDDWELMSISLACLVTW